MTATTTARATLLALAFPALLLLPGTADAEEVVNANRIVILSNDATNSTTSVVHNTETQDGKPAAAGSADAGSGSSLPADSGTAPSAGSGSQGSKPPAETAPPKPAKQPKAPKPPKKPKAPKKPKKK